MFNCFIMSSNIPLITGDDVIHVVATNTILCFCVATYVLYIYGMLIAYCLSDCTSFCDTYACMWTFNTECMCDTER